MIEIRNWITGDLIFESQKETVKEAVEEAVRKNVSLAFADFRGNRLSGTDFHGADFCLADIRNIKILEKDMKGLLNALGVEVIEN